VYTRDGDWLLVYASQAKRLPQFVENQENTDPVIPVVALRRR